MQDNSSGLSKHFSYSSRKGTFLLLQTCIQACREIYHEVACDDVVCGLALSGSLPISDLDVRISPGRPAYMRSGVHLRRSPFQFGALRLGCLSPLIGVIKGSYENARRDLHVGVSS
jgi:hypothetical protein